MKYIGDIGKKLSGISIGWKKEKKKIRKKFRGKMYLMINK